jgi:hypothetical protein
VAGLRLPVCQEIADVDIAFQLGLFLIAEVAVIGANVKLYNPDGLILGKIEARVPSARTGVIPCPGQVEYSPEDFGVSLERNVDPAILVPAYAAEVFESRIRLATCRQAVQVERKRYAV